jgi:hypothetical protein
MVKYHGALDYYVLKRDSQYIILFLDDHSMETYCKYPAENLDGLLNDFLDNKKSTLILEEIYGDVDFNSLFSSKHLDIYFKFYEKYKNNKDVVNADIRILFNNFGDENQFNNLDELFGITNNNTNQNITNIRNFIEKVASKSLYFRTHYNLIKFDYLRIKELYKNTPNVNYDIVTVKILNKINLIYPFSIDDDVTTVPVENQWETFYSGLMEMYIISLIEDNDNPYILLYLGAAHCVIIYKVLVKYYGFQIKRKVKKLNVENKDFMLFTDFDVMNKMCIDYTIM